MLRFIKNPDIEITYREKEKWFNPNLLKGLAAAAVFHLLLGLCFRISPLSYLEQSAPLVPISVEVDLNLPIYSSPQPVIVSPIENPGPPKLLDMPTPSFSTQTTNFSSYLTQDPDFSEIEKIPYTSALDKFEFDFESVGIQGD
ncbi:MAG: hypothetical protein WAM28_01255 [Chlamydiales bacterium]